MSMVGQPDARLHADTGFAHEAFFYAGADQFRDAAISFIRTGLTADEDVLVMVPGAKVDLVRSALGRDGFRVTFADMTEVGRNPARIIPAWRAFVGRCAADGRRARAVGEPIWPGRTPAEFAECQRHEALLNLAFAHDRAMTLMCPYDVDALDPAVIAEARASHPVVTERGRQTASTAYAGLDGWRAVASDPLPEPPVVPEEFGFDLDGLRSLRSIAAERAAGFGLSDTRAGEFVLAVDELATNSVRHGGGSGTMRIWPDGWSLVCEIRDAGWIDEPLVGRVRPTLDHESGRGLWLVNQLCDLVETRSSATGNVIRLRVARR